MRMLKAKVDFYDLVFSAGRRRGEEFAADDARAERLIKRGLAEPAEEAAAEPAKKPETKTEPKPAAKTAKAAKAKKT